MMAMYLEKVSQSVSKAGNTVGKPLNYMLAVGIGCS